MSYNKEKFNGFFKESGGMIFLSIILALLGLIQKELFFIIVLFYIYLIKFFASDFLGKKARKRISIGIWVACIITFASGYYVNHYLPQGEMYTTGEIVCLNDGRGPCGEEHREDLIGLDNPNWAIFLKEYDTVLLMALVLAGLSTMRNSE